MDPLNLAPVLAVSPRAMAEIAVAFLLFGFVLGCIAGHHYLLWRMGRKARPSTEPAHTRR